MSTLAGFRKPEDRHHGALVMQRLAPNSTGKQARQETTAHRNAWAARYLGRCSDPARDAVARRARAVTLTAPCRATIEFKLLTPLAIGFGGGGAAAETGLTVHPTYGCPYLPGTGLKGAAREMSRIDGDGKLSQPDEGIFGVSADDVASSVGRVAFLDGLPYGDLVIERAVLTPHVQPYYDQQPAGSHPAGYYAPNPVEYVVVANGRFVAHLLGNEGSQVERAAILLARAADEIGLGAKTSSGFGFCTASTKIVIDTSRGGRR